MCCSLVFEFSGKVIFVIGPSQISLLSPFDYAAFVVSKNTGTPEIGLTTPVG